MDFVSFVGQALAGLTILGQAGIVLLLVCFLAWKNSFTFRFFGKHAITFAFLIAILSVTGSLFYSQIAGFPPCDLCWYQRIFIYSQALILLVALWKKDSAIADYILALSLAGAIIAIYHIYLQSGGAPLTSCQAGAVSCAEKPFSYFGYITIPVMSLTVFVLNSFLMIIQKKYLIMIPAREQACLPAGRQDPVILKKHNY